MNRNHRCATSSSRSPASCRPATASSAARSASRRSSSPTGAPRSSRTTSTTRRRRTSSRRSRPTRRTRSPTTTWARSSRSSASGTRPSRRSSGRPAQAEQRQLPVRPRRGLPGGEEDRRGREGAARRRPQADPKLFKAWWRLGLVYKMLDRPKEADDALRARHRGQHALLEVVRRARVPLPRLRLQQGGGAGVPGLRHGQGRRRRVPQRLRPGAQEPEAVRAGDRRVQEGDRRWIPSSTTPSTTAAWPTPTGTTRRTATTRRTRPASTSRSSSTNGGKTADGNYVKAANDKLYALSGPVAIDRRQSRRSVRDLRVRTCLSFGHVRTDSDPGTRPYEDRAARSLWRVLAATLGVL